ncbi:MAG: phytanoyl-CoA dioxygenase family protein [Phycisphaeraceae bacterium]
MHTVEVSDTERDSGNLEPAKRDEAVRALEEEGFVGLVNAIEPAILDHVYEGMMEDLAWLEARFGRLPKRGPDGWEGKGKLNGFGPPRRKPYLHRRVLYNEPVLAVTLAMLGCQKEGMGVHCANYDANWSFPIPPAQRADAPRQQVHGDTGPLFPSLSEPEPAFMLNLSIPLVDFTPENGATEIWPGTHRHRPQLSQTPGKERKQQMIEAQRRVRPPERMVAPKGTVVIRDPRAWHAGMPNLTDQTRIMIAMRHCPDWLRITIKNPRTGRKVPRHNVFETGAEDVFGHDWLDLHEEFADGAARQHLLEHYESCFPEAAMQETR